MEKRKKLFWLLGISVVVIGILIYFNQTDLQFVLVGSLFSLVSAIICWWLALKIKSNEVIAYLLGFVLGFIGLLIYFVFYLVKRILNKKDVQGKKKVKP